MRTLSCAFVITGARAPVLASQEIAIDGETIASVRPSPEPSSDLLAMPALVNAHDHGRAARLSSIGSGGRPLETWINYLALFPSIDPYLGALVSLSNSALGGVGTVMMHYTRAQGFTDLPTEIVQVARAARDVGVRVGFAVSMKDRNPLVYGPSEPVLAALPPAARAEIEKKFIRTPPAPAEYIALADAVADAAGNDKFEVQYGPNGVQWCTPALLEAVSEASQRTGRRIHMHLLETRYQREWLDRAYPDGALKYLDSIGFLSPRLTLAHCVWARPDEIELLAERGVTVASNHSSNLHLHSGVAPIATMLGKGLRVALGIDGMALDEDDDALREMRVVRLLQGGTGFEVKVAPRDVLQMAFGNGHLSVMNKAHDGGIAAGAPADLLLLDWSRIDHERLRADLDPIELLLGRATADHIDELIIAGRTVVKAGKIAGADYESARREVLAQMRAGMAKDTFATALTALDRVIEQHYHTAPCC
jgi:cytosine/adenosine deaminase-related metal-dependent hydrolase